MRSIPSCCIDISLLDDKNVPILLDGRDSFIWYNVSASSSEEFRFELLLLDMFIFVNFLQLFRFASYQKRTGLGIANTLHRLLLLHIIQTHILFHNISLTFTTTSKTTLHS